MYIGHIADVGTLALTGVGVTFPFLIIVGSFCALLSAGGAPLAAIALGAGNRARAEAILGNCASALCAAALLISLVCPFIAEPVLLKLGADAATLPYARDYLNIYLFGTVFAFISWGLNAFISTQGFAKTAMATSVLGALLNIVLDPIFIFVFDWGVKGAALATVVAQAASAAWVIGFLVGRKTELRLRARCLRPRLYILRPALALGFSPFVMLSTDTFVLGCINAGLLRYGGYLAVGGVTIALAMVNFLNMPLFGVVQGAQPILSYNYGARRNDRVRAVFRLLVATSLIYSLITWAIMVFVPGIVVRLFTSDDALYASGCFSVRVSMAMIFMLGIQGACQQTFVALNQARVSILLALLRKVVLIIPLTFLLPEFFENKTFAVLLALPVSDFTATCVTMAVFAVVFPRILAKGPPVPLENAHERAEATAPAR